MSQHSIPEDFNCLNETLSSFRVELRLKLVLSLRLNNFPKYALVYV